MKIPTELKTCTLSLLGELAAVGPLRRKLKRAKKMESLGAAPKLRNGYPSRSLDEFLRDFYATIVDGEPDECWEWCGAITSKGYGSLGAYGTTFSAHRLAYMLERGMLPVNMLVCHKCDNKKCCNMRHLFAGTNQDNLNDCIAKGRTSKGEGRSMSKLKNEQVINMRKEHKEGIIGYRKLAQKYNVSRNTVRYIVTNRNWRHLL